MTCDLTREPTLLSEFQPPPLIRDGLVQTILGGFPLRKKRLKALAKPLEVASVTTILPGADEARLACHLTQSRENRPLVVFMPGWGGDHQASYLLSCALNLYAHDLDIARLNMIDHGGTASLNQRLFRADEADQHAASALRALAERCERPLHVIGFSLGGNIALRTLIRLTAANKADTIASLMVVSPSLYPPDTAATIANGPRILRHYFSGKSRALLQAKQTSFPEHYDFSEVLSAPDMKQADERLIRQYLKMEPDAFHASCAVTSQDLKCVHTPTLILSAKDDPCVPYRHAEKLRQDMSSHPHLRMKLTEYGGHCGYLRDYRLRSWADLVALQWVQAHCR